MAAGIGAGLGAIFRAPLGGALLAAEILYLHDMEVEAIVPSLVASIVGYALYGAVDGYAPIFGSHPRSSWGLLPRQFALPPHRFRVPLLATLAVEQAREDPKLALPEATPVFEALLRMERAGASAAAVLDAEGRPVGGISRRSLSRIPSSERRTPISEATSRVALRGTETREEGMRLLAEAGTDPAAAVDGGTTTGLVITVGILRAYRAAATSGRWAPFPAES